MGQINLNSWAWFIKAVSLCYEHPEKAIKRMKIYERSKGETALLAKLATHPSYFGERFVRDHKKQNLARDKEARQAAALLPLLARDAFDTDASDKRYHIRT